MNSEAVRSVPQRDQSWTEMRLSLFGAAGTYCMAMLIAGPFDFMSRAIIAFGVCVILAGLTLWLNYEFGSPAMRKVTIIVCRMVSIACLVVALWHLPDVLGDAVGTLRTLPN